VPPPGVLRRERKILEKARDAELRDLGGLLFEMYRQDRFREDLLHERCARVLDLDERLLEVDGLLAALRRGLPAARCECGAPLPWNSHFCANCGRAAGEPLVTCRRCDAPLAADASFCAHCGTAVDPPAVVAPGEATALELEPAPDSLDL
jgi:Double zinc ribbon